MFAYSLTSTRREIPSLPQRGKKPKGGIPLPPLSSDFSINILMIIAMRGMPDRRGWKHNVQRAPKSDCLFLSGVSTKSKTGIFLGAFFVTKLLN
jgi:hypothetical protein